MDEVDLIDEKLIMGRFRRVRRQKSDYDYHKFFQQRSTCFCTRVQKNHQKIVKMLGMIHLLRL